jgi:hypothetical protein
MAPFIGLSISFHILVIALGTLMDFAFPGRVRHTRAPHPVISHVISFAIIAAVFSFVFYSTYTLIVTSAFEKHSSIYIVKKATEGVQIGVPEGVKKALVQMPESEIIESRVQTMAATSLFEMLHFEDLQVVATSLPGALSNLFLVSKSTPPRTSELHGVLVSLQNN